MQGMIDALEKFGGLVLAANSEPYESSLGIFSSERSEYVIDENRRGGGLVTALDPAMQMLGDRATWVASATGDADAHTVKNGYIMVPVDKKMQYRLLRVFPRNDHYNDFYRGYSNSVLWPIFHNVGVNPVFGPDYYKYYNAYTIVNSMFAKSTMKAFNDIKDVNVSDNPLITVNDYHLMLVPQNIRSIDSDNGQCVRDAVIIYFHHTPWSSWEMYSKLPHRKELIKGLLGSDIIGFHTDGYVENFLECAQNLSVDEGIRITDETINRRNTAIITLNGKDVYVTKFPIGIDADKHRTFADRGGDGKKAANRYIEEGFPEDGILLLGVSRFDYTKGLEKEIMSLRDFLRRNPEYVSRVRLLQVVSSTREGIPEYDEYAKRIVGMADELNKEFMESNGVRPLTLYTKGMSHQELASLYRFADVFIISAAKDGMNLTGFEYGASQLTGDKDKTGAIILSEFTGAKDVIGQHCININPYDMMGFSDAIKEAIEMPQERKKEMMKGIQEAVWGNTVTEWMTGIFDFAGKIKEMKQRKHI